MIDINLDSVVEHGAKLLGKFVQDKDEANRLAHELATMGAKQGHAQTMAQIEVNKSEAESGSLFIAGWRPAIGWTCGLAMFNNFLVVPYAVAFGLEVPSLDLGEMMPVLLGMLGLGYMRTDEKKAGVARKALAPFRGK